MKIWRRINCSAIPYVQPRRYNKVVLVCLYNELVYSTLPGFFPFINRNNWETQNGFTRNSGNRSSVFPKRTDTAEPLVLHIFICIFQNTFNFKLKRLPCRNERVTHFQCSFSSCNFFWKCRQGCQLVGVKIDFVMRLEIIIVFHTGHWPTVG